MFDMSFVGFFAAISSPLVLVVFKLYMHWSMRVTVALVSLSTS